MHDSGFLDQHLHTQLRSEWLSHDAHQKSFRKSPNQRKHVDTDQVPDRQTKHLAPKRRHIWLCYRQSHDFCFIRERFITLGFSFFKGQCLRKNGILLRCQARKVNIARGFVWNGAVAQLRSRVGGVGISADRVASRANQFFKAITLLRKTKMPNP